MTWIKICGITNLEDAQTAVDAGADALGFVFYAKSPRYVSPENAQQITERLPSGVETVGVFADDSAEHISEVTRKAGLGAVQLCGNGSVPLTEYFLESAEHASLKVIPVCQAPRLEEDSAGALNRPATKRKSFALLVDSASNGSIGGSGRAFDWRELSGVLQRLGGKMPLIVAGGLTPENVGEAIRILKPWGVDVSSGVEVRPGKKDPQKIRDFVAAVRQTEKSA